MSSASASDSAAREIPSKITFYDGLFLVLNDDIHTLFEVKKVKCLYANGDPKVFWLVYLINQGENVFAKYMFADDAAPLFVRQMLAITSHVIVTGRHDDLNCFTYCPCKGCYDRDIANVQLLHAESPPVNMLSAQDNKNSMLSDVIASLHTTPVKKLRLAFMAALHWRNFVKKNIARRRAQARTELVRQELIAVAWHPRRFGDWCLDCEERAELAELFAKK